MKNVKKALCLPILFLFLLTSCTRSERIDYSELDRRLQKENALYTVNETDILFSDSVYFAFLSLKSEDDILLTMKEDEEKKLVQVTVSASGDDTSEEFRESFTDFACAVIRAFLPEEYSAALTQAQEGYKELLYTECFENAQSGRYTLGLFSDPIGISVILTRT